MNETTRPEPAPGFRERPDYVVAFEPCPKRVRVELGGETIADSLGVQMMRETAHMPVYYFPMADVAMARMAATDHSTFCPFKGHASYWTVEAGGRTAENAAWSYRAPYPETAFTEDFVAFYWDRFDRWLEEDEEVIVHPRDPRVRIDVLDSRRRVLVTAGGEAVADTRRARFLFETGHPARYYIPAEDVRGELLVPSDHVTGCPYKGWAGYHHLALPTGMVDNAVWHYADPFPEASRVKDYLCFYPEKVDAIDVAGPGA